MGARVTLQGVVRHGRNMVLPVLPGAYAARGGRLICTKFDRRFSRHLGVPKVVHDDPHASIKKATPDGNRMPYT